MALVIQFGVAEACGAATAHILRLDIFKQFALIVLNLFYIHFLRVTSGAQVQLRNNEAIRSINRVAFVVIVLAAKVVLIFW